MPSPQSGSTVIRTADDTVRNAELFALLTQQAHLLIYDCDVIGQRIAWHGPLAKILGYAAEECAPWDLARWETLLHPDDRATTRQLAQIVDRGGAFDVIQRVRHRDGHYVNLQNHGVAIAGAAPRIVGSLAEIATSHPEEQALQILLTETMVSGGPSFFETLAREVGRLLGGRCAFVAWRPPDQTDTLRPVAVWCRDRTWLPADLSLRGSPIRPVFEQGYYEVVGDLPTRFSQWTEQCGGLAVASFAGVALKGVAGGALGLFAVMFDAGTARPPALATILRLVAVRAAAELERFLLEREIAVGQALYRQVVEGLPEGVVVARDDQVLFANRAAARLLGYRSPAEMLGISAVAHLPPAVRAELGKPAADDRAPLVYEATLRRHDCTDIEVDLTTTRIEFEGQPAFQLVLHDITERRRFERVVDAVHRATVGVYGTAFFESLVNDLGPLLRARQVLVGRLVDGPAARLHVVAAWREGVGSHPPFADFPAGPGSPAETVLAEGFCEIHGDLAERYPREAAEFRALGVDSYLGVTLRAGANRPLGLLSVEYGQDRPLTAHAGAILRLFAGRAAAELERLAVEEALRAGEARFHTLAESSPVGIFELNRDHACTYVNERWCEITGFNREQAMGDGWLQSLHPEDQTRVREWRAVGNGDFTAEMRHIQPTGTVRWVNVRLHGIGDGQPTGFVGTVDDITERVEAAREIRRLNLELEQRVADRTAQLAAANAELEAFSYSVSHDLRSPLRALDGFSRALEEDFTERLDDTGRDFLRRIRGASQRMGLLIDDLLRLSRASRAEIRREPVDLAALALEVAAELRSQHPNHPVEFVCTPGLEASADRSLARIVLYNLLDNAWKYTRRQPAPRIELALVPERAPGAAPVFLVRDNGAGFDMRHAGRLFAPFHRLHSPAEFEGTGIGLATVKRILARHGGRAWAEGRVNQGANFYFTFGGFSA